MHYTKDSFSKCSFNPMIDEKMLETYPSLEEIIDPKWKTEVLLDRLIRYSIMVYDPKSSLVSENITLSSRKKIALELSLLTGVDKNKLDSIMACEYGEILPELVVRYLKTFPRSMEWAILAATENKLWETVAIIMSPLKKDEEKDMLGAIMKKEKILEEMEKDIVRVESYYKIVFGDDVGLQDKIKKGPISPQSIAKLSSNV